MEKSSRQNWIINIENCAAAIESCLGSAVVNSVLERYGAHSIRDLHSNVLSDVFNDLYAIEADMK